jgi:signal transduction histidine kinase
LKLRTRILTLFAFLGVFPVLTLGLLGYVRAMTAVESLLQEETSAIAHRVASDLLDRYALRAAELQLVAGNTETERLLQDHADHLGGADSESHFAAHSYLSAVWDLIRPSYHWIEIRDSSDILRYVMGEGETLPTGERAGALEPGHTELGEEEPETSSRDPGQASRPPSRGVVELEFPVTIPPSGDTVGVAVASVRSGAVLSDEFLGTAFGRGGYTTLFHRGRGTVIYHPSRRLLNQPIDRLFSQGGWDVEPAVLEADSGSFTYRENDSLRVASYLNVPSPPWTIVVSAAVEEFASPFARMRDANLAVMLLVVVAIGLSFFLMTRRATSSLEQLTLAADEVARGELSPQIPGEGGDEVGRLSRAFRIMVEEVRKMLERVEETRQMAVMGEFASQVSHEIRTPLTSIKLNLQELGRDAEQGSIPEDSAPAVRICLREVERLDRAVSSVLSMVPTHPPEREACSLHDILADATEAVAPQLRQTNVRVECRFRAAQVRVLGDPQALESVFVNLLVNASEAMPSGGTVFLDSENGDSTPTDEGVICVRVSDEGPGVPVEIRGKIFRPFVSTKTDGTGFGLAVARRTVEEHEGRIDLDPASNEDIGATFVVELPLAGRELPASEDIAPVSPEDR